MNNSECYGFAWQTILRLPNCRLLNKWDGQFSVSDKPLHIVGFLEELTS